MTTASTSTSGVAKKRMAGELRRNQILSIAAQLFSRKGFNGTTTKEIAEQAGVSEAIIFRHFQTKQDLYSAILDRKVAECLEQLWSKSRDAMDRRDDKAVFLALASEFLEMHREDPTLTRLLFYSALEGHEMAKRFFDTTARTARERIANYIKERCEDGVFRKVDPTAAARAFLSLVMYRAIVRELFQDNCWQRSSSREAASEITDLFLHGIVSPPKASTRQRR
ncbi:MAG: TetR/AcrR family transcriptional regulator [Acidobacteriota bacterium]